MASKVLSRRVMGVFAAVMLLITAELCWWVAFQIYRTQSLRVGTALQLQREVDLAVDVLALLPSLPEQLPASPPAELLATHFPNLLWRAGGTTSPALAARYPGWGVVVDLHKQAALLAKHASHVRMFLWEGGFFLLMVFLGGVMIWRSMQREVMLIRQQANFLSAVTHELKSPLASLRLFIQTMQMRELSVDKRAQYLGDMRNDVDRLDALVGNLLAVARLDAGAFVVQPEIMELNQDVGQLVAGLRETLASRQASLQFCPSPRPLPVRLDAQALQTLVRNLVDNAVKYGGPQAAVSVHLWHRPPNAVLEVRDRGLGIAAAEQAKIFDKFYRVGDELVRQSEGSGLGLYLVRALMQSHGGEVQVESAGLGEGASFSLRLPLVTSAAVG